jgi:hypothetical protein
MFLECPYVTNFWASLTKTLHILTGLQQLHTKHIVYGLSDPHTTPQQLANYLIVLAKSTNYKTYIAATNSTHLQAANYQHMLRLRLQFRLQLEMHHAIWNNNLQTFQDYWLHKNVLGKISNGGIVVREEP